MDIKLYECMTDDERLQYVYHLECIVGALQVENSDQANLIGILEEEIQRRATVSLQHDLRKDEECSRDIYKASLRFKYTPKEAPTCKEEDNDKES